MRARWSRPESRMAEHTTFSKNAWIRAAGAAALYILLTIGEWLAARCAARRPDRRARRRVLLGVAPRMGGAPAQDEPAPSVRREHLLSRAAHARVLRRDAAPGDGVGAFELGGRAPARRLQRVSAVDVRPQCPCRVRARLPAGGLVSGRPARRGDLRVLAVPLRALRSPRDAAVVLDSACSARMASRGRAADHARLPGGGGRGLGAGPQLHLLRNLSRHVAGRADGALVLAHADQSASERAR